MTLYQLGQHSPQLAADAYVAPNAIVIGKVVLAAQASVWFGATLRGDNEIIAVGARSNVQDSVVMHTDPGFPLTVGADVTIGHQAMVHGCTVGDGTLIGIQAVILNGAVIGKGCLIAAGALVTERKVFPDGCLIVGTPAKALRELNDEERASLLHAAADYAQRAARYRIHLHAV